MLKSETLSRWRTRLVALPREAPHPLDLAGATTLLEAAYDVRSMAYARYSQFKVGAAVRCDDKIFAGCNVENASFGATMCAERNAAFNAIASGCRDFLAVAIVADAPRPPPPCGICRQVFAEFSRHTRVLMANLAGDIDISSVDQLLPLAFELGSTTG
jgi:cytidine deaminase